MLQFRSLSELARTLPCANFRHNSWSHALIPAQCSSQAAALKGARSELEQATQQKVGALMKLSVAQMSAGRAEDRADRSQQQADALKAQLEQVC